VKVSVRSSGGVLLLSFVWCALAVFCVSGVRGEAAPPDAPDRSPSPHETHIYHLDFSLQVTGDVTLLTRTRFCRVEDLHLKLAAAQAGDAWAFRLLGLNRAAEGLNFGIGEGPRRHQRYVLLEEDPSGDQVQHLERRVIEKENLYGCGMNDPLVALLPGEDRPDKKTYFNHYLLENPRDSFRFVRDTQGHTRDVENRTEVRALSQEGGRKAKPRFFELLEYALLCVPPFSGPSVYDANLGEPVRWEMDCRQILDGLALLVKEVYGRKMTLLDAEGGSAQHVVYQGRFLPGTKTLWARAEADRLEPVGIRVSGFKGTIWVKTFRREICLEVGEKRILKDIFEISFGIVRDTKIMPVACEMNSVRVALVDERFALGSAPVDAAVPPDGS